MFFALEVLITERFRHHRVMVKAHPPLSAFRPLSQEGQNSSSEGAFLGTTKDIGAGQPDHRNPALSFPGGNVSRMGAKWGRHRQDGTSEKPTVR